MIETKLFIDFNNGTVKCQENDIWYEVHKQDSNEPYSLAIVGSRKINNEQIVNRIINCCKFIFGKPTKVVSGGANGVDKIGQSWANKNNIETSIFIPDWEHEGKKAGMLRNHDIIKNCDLCLAIWDGESHGTQHDFELCEKYKKDLLIFNVKDYMDKSFCGFYYRKYNEDKIVQQSAQKQYQTQHKNNRWLPQPGIIKV